MKRCVYCNVQIDESKRYAMIITKEGNKIIEFECFHFQCWKKFFEGVVRMRMKEIKIGS